MKKILLIILLLYANFAGAQDGYFTGLFPWMNPAQFKSLKVNKVISHDYAIINEKDSLYSIDTFIFDREARLVEEIYHGSIKQSIRYRYLPDGRLASWTYYADHIMMKYDTILYDKKANTMTMGNYNMSDARHVVHYNEKGKMTQWDQENCEDCFTEQTPEKWKLSTRYKYIYSLDGTQIIQRICSEGEVGEYNYDKNGKLTLIKVADDVFSRYFMHTFDYNDKGLILTERRKGQFVDSHDEFKFIFFK
ncbi:MAG: hypothetical protein V2A54_09540 [Bacteroidota bacterium]